MSTDDQTPKTPDFSDPVKSGQGLPPVEQTVAASDDPNRTTIDGVHPQVPDIDPDSIGRGEGVGQAKEVEGLSQNQIVFRRLVRHRGALFGMITLAVVTLLSIITMGLGPIPGLWKYQDYLAARPIENGGAPTVSFVPFSIGNHPFGQDSIGRDYFAEVMKGIQTTLLVMFVIGLVVLIIGVAVGSLAGYYGKVADTALMRVTDLFITLPVLVLGAVLGKMLSTIPAKYNWTPDQQLALRYQMPLLLGLALGAILWPTLARLTRSEFMSLREREFVESARVAGASDWRIITKHMLPNAVGVIIVNTTLVMSSAVNLEAALSFLGFGIREPVVSLGALISDNQGAFSTRPWLFWWPGLFIILIALSVNFIGDGLRDAFDPRTRRIPSATQMRRAEAELQAVSRTHSVANQSGAN